MSSGTAPTCVLLIGWQTDAYTALVGHGCHVTAVVTPRHLRRAKAHAPDGPFIVVPNPADAEDVLAGLSRAQLSLRDFDIACTISEQAMVGAALLGQECRQASMAVDTALALRDKYLQKRHVRDAGLAVADTWIVNVLSDLEFDQTLPVVIKPINGAGTHNTHLIHNADDLSNIATIDTNTPKGPWLVEAFIRGNELHVDGVVRNGAVQGFAVSRYLHNLIEIKSDAIIASTTLSAHEHPELYNEVDLLLSHALQSMGHTDGIFHAEAFVNDHGLVFSECGGRLGGSLVQGATLTQAGIDLADEWARAVLGLAVGDRREPSASHCGWINLQTTAGVVRHAPNRTELIARPGCLEAEVMLVPGTEAPDRYAGTDSRAGHALVEGASEQEVRSRLYDLAAWFADVVVVE